MIETKNSAEAQIHTIKKDLKEFGDQVTAEQKTEVETAITQVETDVTSNDKEKIQDSLTKLFEKLTPLMEAKNRKESTDTGTSTVDAEFTETK